MDGDGRSRNVVDGALLVRDGGREKGKGGRGRDGRQARATRKKW